MKLKNVTLGMLILSCFFAKPALAQTQEKKEPYKVTSKERLVDNSGRVPLSGGKTVLLETNTEMAAAAGDAPDSSRSHWGQIKGQVVLAGDRSPLPGVRVRVLDSDRETVSDEQGKFLLSEVPVGTRSVEFTAGDFVTVIKTDILVKVKQTANLYVEMQFNLLQEQVTVTVGYFNKKNEEPVSSTTFNLEEIRRSAGGGDDVSRMVAVLPSVAKVNDNSNGLVVRGGSTSENSFYIDNIEVPNINHFPAKGSTGGPIGLINTDFIQDVTFFAGGFSPLFGDRLSSVMDIRFRPGNNDKIALKTGINLAGLNFSGEGPLGKKSSWILSARRSYLDLMAGAFGSDILPKYGDIQGKFSFDLGHGHTLDLINLTGIDTISQDKEKAIKNHFGHYGKSDSSETTTGLNWRALWPHGYSETSLAFSRTHYRNLLYEIQTDVESDSDNSFENEWKFRNVNYWHLNGRQQLQFGVEAKRQEFDYDVYISSFVDDYGNTQSSQTINQKKTMDHAALFGNLSWNLLSTFTLNAGFRADYSSYQRDTSFSPRFSFSWQLGQKTTLTGAAGEFRQSIPLTLLFYLEKPQAGIEDMQAFHYVLGISQILADDVRMTLEGYYKKYSRYPMNPDYPDLFLIETIDGASQSFHADSVVSTGQARSYGLEFTIQKKLARKLYGIACFSYSRSQYQTLVGEWRNRISDNRFIFSCEGGYKPSSKWEYSVRWTIAGGAPYTPFDLEESSARRIGIYNYSRINMDRNPAYHSLNARIDRHFHFSGSTLTVFLDVWNLYNRKNIASRYWDETENKPAFEYQWSTMPILGIDFAF